MKWEKKFDLRCDGDVVWAEYERKRMYRLRFLTGVEAETFVKAFKSAQTEIEKYGKLQTKITIAANASSDTHIKFSFMGKDRTTRMCCELESINEMLSFYRRLRSQILTYS